MQWKIYYGDGSTYSDVDGPPQLAPSLNVQVVAQADPEVGRSLLAGADYYCWYPERRDGVGEWVGSDLFGLWDYLATPGFKVVKFGRDLPSLTYRDILAQAMEDSSLPVKSARYAREPS